MQATDLYPSLLTCNNDEHHDYGQPSLDLFNQVLLSLSTRRKIDIVQLTSCVFLTSFKSTNNATQKSSHGSVKIHFGIDLDFTEDVVHVSM